jgi:hypothetical protein
VWRISAASFSLERIAKPPKLKFAGSVVAGSYLSSIHPGLRSELTVQFSCSPVRSLPSGPSHRRKEYRKQTEEVHDMYGEIKSVHEDIRHCLPILWRVDLSAVQAGGGQEITK